MKLEKEEREAMIDALSVFGLFPRDVYEKYTDERLVDEYNRVVGDK